MATWITSKVNIAGVRDRFIADINSFDAQKIINIYQKQVEHYYNNLKQDTIKQIKRANTHFYSFY